MALPEFQWDCTTQCCRAFTLALARLSCFNFSFRVTFLSRFGRPTFLRYLSWHPMLCWCVNNSRVFCVSQFDPYIELALNWADFILLAVTLRFRFIRFISATTAFDFVLLNIDYVTTRPFERQLKISVYSYCGHLHVPIPAPCIRSCFMSLILPCLLLCIASCSFLH